MPSAGKMKLLLVFIFVTLCAASTKKRDILTIHGSLDDVEVDKEPCPEYPYESLIESYRDHTYNLSVATYKLAAIHGRYNFVMSPHLLWLTLAGVAEGADRPNQQKLFQLLTLPEDKCLRQKFYEIAVSRLTLSPYVNLYNKRSLFLDEDATPLPKWHNYVTKHSLLNVTSGPIQSQPVIAANKLRYLMSAQFPKLNLRGNSVLFNTMDFNGLWTEAFDDAVIKRAPFYNLAGERIGSVDLMTTRQRAYIGVLPDLHVKLLALTLGERKEYVMIIALVVDNTDIQYIIDNIKFTIVRETIAALKDSIVPIDIAMPRFTMTSEIDAKILSEDIGIKDFWTDPGATKYVSTPPALPGNYVQRTTVTLDKYGAKSPPYVPPSGPADSKNQFSKEFILDRPFLFGLFDTETFSVIITAMYTQPTYPN